MIRIQDGITHAVGLVAGIAAAALALLTATPAAAVPAFAVQTGKPCQNCHVGGFGPQLTTFGRQFKLQGYTLRTGTLNVPISAMAIASLTDTARPQPPAPNFAPNNNLAVDQISLFLAGGVGDHLGGFVQATYDGVAKAFHWDNLDMRATDTFTVKDKDVTLGVSLNNAPTVQDVWATLPAWGFPYTTSTLAPSPSASPLFNNALAQNTLGVTGYVWLDDEFYLEAGVYGSPGATSLARLGVDPTSPGSIRNLAPYVRLAAQPDLGPGQLELGVFGMRTDINPGLDRSTGLADHYTDLGVDASYIVSSPGDNSYTVNARYLHEQQSLDATCALAMATNGCSGASLDDFRIDGSFYWHDQYGVTLGLFDTTGQSNSVIYAGNRTAKPDSAGFVVQADTTLFGAGSSPLGSRFNSRVGLQYTGYTEFNGAVSNYDGAGGNAGDNNTVRIFLWVAY